MGKFAKYIYMIIILVSVICSQALMQEINLQRNGGFEEGDLGWGLGASGKIDTDISFSGKASLRMHGIATNTWNVVRGQQLTIIQNNTYVLTLYSKNEAYTGEIKMGLRWIDNSGQSTIRYDWEVLDNDTDWEYYSLKVTPPAGASKVQIFLFAGADVVGNVWYDEIMFYKFSGEEDVSTGTGPIGFKGSVLTEVNFTPEEKWVAGNRVQLYSDIAFGETTKAYIHLGGWLPRENFYQSFADVGSVNGELALKRCYLEIDGPWLSGLKSLRTTLGDLSLNYSPYLLQLDRWDLWYWDVMDNSNDPCSYNRSRRGISVETIEPNKANFSSFILWDGDPDQYAYGGKLVFGAEKGQLDLVAVNYLDQKGISGGEKPRESEFSYSLDGKITIGPAQLQAVKVSSQKSSYQNDNQISGVSLANLKYEINDYASLAYEVWSFDKDFDPRFRDRTPRFDPYTGKKLQWNKVDRFAGQIGQGLQLSINSNVLEFNLRNCQATRNQNEKLRNIDFNLSGKFLKTSFETYGEYEEIDTREEQNLEAQTYLFSMLSYPLAESERFKLNIEGNYRLNKTTSDLEKRKHILLNTQIKQGYFNGAKIFLGKRLLEKDEKQHGFVCGMDFLFANAINLTIRYASPNEIEPLDTEQRIPRYDERGEPILPDNIIKLSASIDF